MDNKVTKKRLNDHLEYDWFKYVIILIATILIGYFTFNQIQSNRDYETIDLFVSSYTQHEHNYINRTRTAMEKEMDVSVFGENVIRQIGIENQDPLGKDYNTLFMTHGQQTSDILILGESLLKEGQCMQYVKLTDELLTKYILPKGLQISDLEYMEYTNEKTGEVYRCGIRIDTFPKMTGDAGVFEFDWKKTHYKDKDWGENLPDSKFYLVINPISVNIGEYGKKGKSQNKQALFCVNQFIQYYHK